MPKDADHTANTTTPAPAPDDPRKPDSPDELTSRSWGLVLRSTVKEFTEDQCTDLAAALTFRAVLAGAPAVLAVTSLLGLVGDPQTMVQKVMDSLEGLLPAEALATVEPMVQSLTQAPAAGLALIIGLVTALWSASGYVAAFSRGMNRVYEVEEGRPFWKLRPALLLLTLVLVIIAALVVVALVLSGGVAQSVGSALGLSEVTRDGVEHRKVARGADPAGDRCRAAVSLDAECAAAEVPVVEYRGARRHRGGDARRPRVRLLRLALRQL